MHDIDALDWVVLLPPDLANCGHVESGLPHLRAFLAGRTIFGGTAYAPEALSLETLHERVFCRSGGTRARTSEGCREELDQRE
jgi:hypothetical protein